ncbi:pilus assembly protein [Escherichia coli]|nr:pilus assembly protein [Escherichia coli]
MKLKHVGMIVVSVLAMSSAAVSAAEGDESVTTTVNGGVLRKVFITYPTVPTVE